MYFDNRRITWVPRCEPAGGLGACYPRKFWNFDALKRSVLVFWDGDFFLKCSLNWVLFLCLFLFGIFTFAGYQFQLYIKRTLLGVLVYLSTQMSKSGFFLSRSWLKLKRTKTTREVKVMLPFSCLMFKFSFICNYYNLYVNLRLKIERTKLAFF